MELMTFIQATLAPLFLTNGIALLTLVQQNRYARTSDRLNYFFDNGKEIGHLPEINYLEKRLFLIRSSMLLAYISILFAIVTSLFILIISLIPYPMAEHIAQLISVAFFSASLLSFFVAMTTAIAEVRLSFGYFNARIKNHK